MPANDEADFPTLQEDLSREQWLQVEDAFRHYAFRICYYRTHKGEGNLFLRFANSLVDSAQPIRNRQLALDWYLRDRRRHTKRPKRETAPI